MIKNCSPGKYRYFSRLWQQSLNFSNLLLLGSCTYSHSYCPEAPDACVKYVAQKASCLNECFEKLVPSAYINPRPPKVFLTHTLTQGGWMNHPPPNSWTETSIKMKFWQWIHMHLRVSQKIFCLLLLYCLRCCHDKPWKQEFFFPKFLTLFKKFIIKSLIQAISFYLKVAQVLLIPKT